MQRQAARLVMSLIRLHECRYRFVDECWNVWHEEGTPGMIDDSQGKTKVGLCINA